MTLAEKALWIRIRNRQLGVKFRRQVPIGHWIADFACLDPKIVIEVDDTSHEWKNEEERSAYLEAQGFTLFRLNNKDMAFNPEGVIGYLAEIIEELRNGD